VELNPVLGEAKRPLGVALASQGHLGEAIAKFKEAIRVSPDYAEAYYDLGLALDRTGQTDEAIREFRRAIRLKPGFTVAKMNLRSALTRRDGSAAMRGSEPGSAILRLHTTYAQDRLGQAGGASDAPSGEPR